MEVGRHELWDELEAFDPKWQLHYDTTHEAAIAAGVESIWMEYCSQLPQRHGMACRPGQVTDVIRVVRKQKEAASSSSLPYRLDTIGTVRAGCNYDE